MRWKENVEIVKKNHKYTLVLGEKKKIVDEKDIYLVEAISEGNKDNELLKILIMKKEKINETAASFGLGQFILDYGTFLKEDREHYMIED